MLFAEVIPAKRGKLGLPFFDYLIPSDLESRASVGQLVIVPLRSKKEYGVIRAIKSSSQAPHKLIKPLDSLVSETPFLSPSSLKFFEEIAELYHASLGLVIKSALPPLQKRKLSKVILSNNTDVQQNNFGKPKLFIYKNNDEKKDYILKNISIDGQTLILVPEQTDIEKMVELIKEKNEIITVSGYQSEKDHFTAWFSIRRGDQKIIIGTRSALLFSFQNLRAILVDNESHPSHKSWDSAPRLNARDASLTAGKHYGAAVHLMSHTPSVETYYFSKRGVYEFSGSSTTPKLKHELEIINMNQEFRAKNFSPLSLFLEEELKKGGGIFLFCNRRGSAAYVMCRDCATVFTCQNCNRPYTYHENRKMLVCHHCRLEETMSPSCKKCGGVTLAYYGGGTEKIAKEVRKIIGKTWPIIEINSEKNFPEKISDNNFVIVGTTYAMPYIEWDKLRLMTLIDADTPLFIPEFRSSETVFHSIRDADYNLPSTATLCLQTSHPDHPVYTGLFQPEIFYENEIKTRKLFGYPPFRYLLKLFYGAESKIASIQASNHLKQALSGLTKGSSDITISEPIELLPSFKDGKYWFSLVIRLPYGSYKQLSRQILKLVPDVWKVDPNPNTLLS